MVLGMIAEDASDIAVMKELTAKLIPPRSFSVKHFAGFGCGKLRRKCRAWAEALLKRGCAYLVVVHDLDSANEARLRGELQQQIRNVRFTASVILIPAREIESWLLSDAGALRKVFSLKKNPTVPASPENLTRPKEHLRDLVWKAGQKRYINTIHNSKIAATLAVSKLARCPSFGLYPKFLAQHK